MKTCPYCGATFQDERFYCITDWFPLVVLSSDEMTEPRIASAEGRISFSRSELRNAPEESLGDFLTSIANIPDITFMSMALILYALLVICIA
jgi:hypothetical protein